MDIDSCSVDGVILLPEDVIGATIVKDHRAGSIATGPGAAVAGERDGIDAIAPLVFAIGEGAEVRESPPFPIAELTFDFAQEQSGGVI